MAMPLASCVRAEAGASTSTRSAAPSARLARAPWALPSHPSHACLTGRARVLPAATLSRRAALLGMMGGGAQRTRAANGAEQMTAQETVESEPAPRDQVVLGGIEDPNTCPPTRLTHNGRIVAMGDLHGDLRKTLMALKVAGVVEERNGRPHWVGEDTLVIQMGDILDRGDNEIAILSLLREVGRMAREQGGDVVLLNGNHESLNVAGDFRYVTPGAFFESAIAAGLTGEQAYEFEFQLQARFALWSPGGPLARELAKNPTVLIVNDTVFVHGGLTVEHIEYGLEKINLEVAQWMRGDPVGEGGRPAPPPFLAMGDQSSLMWNRTFSKERFSNPRDKYTVCQQLNEALQAIKCERMVVGHTPQFSGCNAECNRKVWRIDVGMSAGVLDARPEILELTRDPVTGAADMRVITGVRSPSRSNGRATAGVMAPEA